MKYMLIMRSTAEAAAEFANTDFEEVINAMGRYNEQMMQAGVMLDGAGLSDASEGAVVNYDDEVPVVTDGPYGEIHELFNGFWMLEVPSKADAIEWARRAPLGRGARMEIRRVTDESDFADFADNEFIQKEEGWRAEQAERRAHTAQK
jgi:hypothetical protein